MLPVGDTTLRAVAVNQYGKVSNEYVGTYKVNGKPVSVFMDTQDQFKAFTLGKTKYDDFKKSFGAGTEKIIDTADTASGKALQVSYDWGTACFTDVGHVLYAVNTGNHAMIGPRGSKVGMRLGDLIALFRDRGQAANAKGNRSLYYNKDRGFGRYWKDSDTAARVEYVYWREDKATTTLTYSLENDAVIRIEMVVSGLNIE